MPYIHATATASPPHRLDAATVRAWLERLYAGRRELPALLRMVEGGGVGERQAALPPERLVTPRPFAARNAEYAEAALALGEEAARRALDRAGLGGEQVDLVLTTSCTGLLIPSLVAHLAPRLGLRPDVVRLPITELGCAAGAAALARAGELCRARPGAVALVLAVELCSLTFQRGDTAMANLVAATLFGDGAAAVVVGERPPPGPALELGPAASWLFPASTRLMGFDLGDEGLRLVLSREVPAFLQGRVRPLVERLLASEGLEPAALRLAVLHPGGRRILDQLEDELGLAPALLGPSREVLARHGNMSSATVLFVLDRALAAAPALPDGAPGILAAFGPGFAAELSLVRWRSR